MKATDLPPQGDPRSAWCRWCDRAKVRRYVHGFAHLLCGKCDAPDVPGWTATWEQA